MTRRSRLRQGSNQHKKTHKPFQSTYWNFMILPALLAIVLLLQSFGLPWLEDVTTVRRVYASQMISPVPTEKPQSDKNEAPAPDLEQASQTPGGGVDAFVRRVHILESSAGQNTNPYALHNVCAQQGKANPYGYGGMQMMICFDSLEEATARIVRWYEEHIEQMAEAEVYCYYNLGLKTNDCEYWHKAKTL